MLIAFEVHGGMSLQNFLRHFLRIVPVEWRQTREKFMNEDAYNIVIFFCYEIKYYSSLPLE